MIKILIMSDTHGDRANFIKLIEQENPNYTIHAGDFCCPITLISKYVDYFVAGNNDSDGDSLKLFEIDGIKFMLTHGHQYSTLFSILKGARDKQIFHDAKIKDVRVVITGHTHVEHIEEREGILHINPGSLEWPRNNTGTKTYAILNIEKGEIIDYQIKEWNPS